MRVISGEFSFYPEMTLIKEFLDKMSDSSLHCVRFAAILK